MQSDGQGVNPRTSPWGALFGRGSIGRYGLLGFSGIAVDVAVYAGLILLGILPVVATVVSSFLGIVTNYVANAVFNFRVRLDRRQAVKFVVVGVIGLVVAAGVLQLALVLGAGVWWSKLISLAVVVPAQFFANKSWTFKNPTSA